MPRLVDALPKYRKHKASGQAVVTLNGRDPILVPTAPALGDYRAGKLRPVPVTLASWTLKAVRQRMVDEGLSRRYVNDHTARI